MTQTTQNKERRVVVEVSSSDPFNKTDIQNAMDDLFNKHGGEPYTVTEIDMTQYVSRAEVEGMLSSLQTVIDAPPDGEYERGHGDGMDTACREFRSLLDEGGNDEEDTR